MDVKEKDILLRDIARLQAAIDRDWLDIKSFSLCHDERTALREHIDQCVKDIKGLVDRLETLTGSSSWDARQSQ
jgi:hypothetical protein